MSKLRAVEPLALDATEYTFFCPGCKATHWVRTSGKQPCWSFNGDVDSPTLNPSILVRGRDQTGDTRCHSYVKDGQIQFLPDCTHALAGKTVALETI